MPTLPSWIWLVIIVAGGAAVVVGNIKYTTSKGHEDKVDLANEKLAFQQ
jgi:hypothetical protein